MERTYTMEDLVVGLRRRWKRAAVVAGIVAAVAALAISRVPSEYRARALVMVEPMHPDRELVTPVISRTLEERVKSVRAQMYSRGLLAPAIEELKLYPKIREKDGMDGAVEALRSDLEVNAEGDDAFSIVVKGRDPEMAARVANRLAELFIEGNLQVRQGQVTRTREIISQKLEDLRSQLAQAEAKIAAFKREHRDELPELIEARMRERGDLTRQAEAIQAYIHTAQVRLDLAGTQPFGKDTEVGRLEDEEETVRATYGAVAAAHTADHPDVQRIGRQLADVRSRLERAKARASANDLEQRRMQEAMRRGQAELAKLEQRIAAVDKQITAGPGIGAQLAEVGMGAELLRAKVTQLVSKKAEAEIAAELEAKNAPSEFRVLESAVPPALPATPNRQLALLLAVLGGLLVGGAVALGAELSDRSLRTATEASQWLALPVLATVPKLVVHTASGRMLALPASRSAEA